MQTEIPTQFGKENGVVEGEVEICDDNGSDEEMEVEEEGKGGKGVDPEFKEKVMKILTDSGYIQKRPSKLTIDDYLKLLYLFNSNQIHFR